MSFSHMLVLQSYTNPYGKEGNVFTPMMGRVFKKDALNALNSDKSIIESMLSGKGGDISKLSVSGVAEWSKINQMTAGIQKQKRAAQVGRQELGLYVQTQEQFIKNSKTPVKDFFGSLGKGLLNAGAWALATTAISHSAKLIDDTVRSTENLIDKSEEVKSNWQEMNKSQETANKLAEESSDRFAELSERVNQRTGENQSLSADEYAEYNTLRAQVAESFPNLVSGYDVEGRAIINLTGSVKNLSQAYAELESSNRQKQRNDFSKTVGKSAYQELYGDRALWGDFKGGSVRNLSNLESLYDVLNRGDENWIGDLLALSGRGNALSHGLTKGWDYSAGTLDQLASSGGWADILSSMYGNKGDAQKMDEWRRQVLPLIASQMATMNTEVGQTIQSYQQEMQRQMQDAFSSDSFSGISDGAKNAMLSTVSIFDDPEFYKQFDGEGGANKFTSWVNENLVTPLSKAGNPGTLNQLTNAYDDFIKGATGVFDYQSLTNSLIKNLRENGVGEEFLAKLAETLIPEDWGVLEAHAKEVFGDTLKEGTNASYAAYKWAYENLDGKNSADYGKIDALMANKAAADAQTLDAVKSSFKEAVQYESDLNELVKTFNETGIIDWEKYNKLNDAGQAAFRKNGLGQWEADEGAAREAIKQNYADQVANSEGSVREAQKAEKEAQRQLQLVQGDYKRINDLKAESLDYDNAQLDALKSKTEQMQEQLDTAKENTKQAEMQLGMLKMYADGKYSYSAASQYSESGDDARANKGATDIVGEGLKTGRRYTNSFKASADYLFGDKSGWEGWSDKQINSAYKNASKYWGKDGSVDLSHFTNQVKKAGAISQREDGKYSFNDGWTMDKLASTLGMSAQMLSDIIGGVNEYLPDKDKLHLEEENKPETPPQKPEEPKTTPADDGNLNSANQNIGTATIGIGSASIDLGGAKLPADGGEGNGSDDKKESPKEEPKDNSAYNQQNKDGAASHQIGNWEREQERATDEDIMWAQRQARQEAQIRQREAADTYAADRANDALIQPGAMGGNVPIPTPSPTGATEVVIPNANITLGTGGSQGQNQQTVADYAANQRKQADDQQYIDDLQSIWAETNAAQGTNPFMGLENQADDASKDAADAMSKNMSDIPAEIDEKGFVKQTGKAAESAGEEAGGFFGKALANEADLSGLKDKTEELSSPDGKKKEEEQELFDPSKVTEAVAAVGDLIATPVSIPVDADTSAAESGIAAVEGRLAQPVTKVVNIVYNDPGWSAGGGGGMRVSAGGGMAGADGLSLAGGSKNTLVGELAPEIVVNRKTGTWRLASFPQLTRLNRGDIVFNGRDTEKILSGNSNVGFAGGSMANGGIKGGKSYAGKTSLTSMQAFNSVRKSVADIMGAANKASPRLPSASQIAGALPGNKGSSKGSSGGGADGGGGGHEEEAAKKDFSKLFDWIERALEVAKKATEKLIKSAKEKVGYIAKNIETDLALASNKSEMEKNQAGYDRYNQLLEEISTEYTDLDADIIKKIKEGDIDIAEYEGELKGHIELYQKWYEKSEKCLETIEDLKDQERELNLNKLKYIEDYYDAKLDRLDARADMSDARLDYKSTFGQEVTADDYTDVLAATQEKVTQLMAARAAYDAQFQALVASGVLVYDSDDWHEYIGTLEDFDQKIIETEVDVGELNDSIANLKITNLEWALNVLTAAQEKFEGIIDFHDSQGTDNIDSYYVSLIKNGLEQISNLEAQNAELHAQQAGLDVLSEKYQEIQETLVSNEQSIWDIKSSQESWNDAIADLKIKKLQEQREELEKTNDAYEAQMELEQALEDLEKAKNQKNKLIYKAGIGYTYTADAEAVRDAQDQVDELRHEQTLRKIDEAIDAIEKAKKTDNVYNYEGTDVIKSFGSDAIASKLYDLVTSSADLEGMVAKGINTQTSSMLAGGASSGVAINIGDINLYGVQDVNGLAEAITNQLPNIMLQKLYSK